MRLDFNPNFLNYNYNNFYKGTYVYIQLRGFFLRNFIIYLFKKN